MRALSLTQPWSTLVAIGAKTIETRSWRTDYLGPVLIHAAKKCPRDARLLAALPPFDAVLLAQLQGRSLPLGAVVAVAELAAVFRFTERTGYHIAARARAGGLPPYELDFGDFTAGRYGFRLTHVQPLPEPIEARGALGLWYPDAKLVQAVAAQLEAVPA